MGLYGPEILILALWLGWWLDKRFGEPTRWHPLVGFGRLVHWLALSLNPESQPSTANGATGAGVTRLLGVLALLLMVLPLSFGLWLFLRWLEPGSGWQTGLTASVKAVLMILFQGGVLYLALGAKSLDQHLAQIEQPLMAGDLDKARFYVGWIVSRDTADMDPMRVTRAAIESGLENGSDSAFAPIFWFLLAGAPGVLLYRLSNTLDAMWGYKTSHWLHFGWAAARFDDLLNLVPARISALFYALNSPHGCSGTKAALRCWQQQGQQWESPNAGPVMASGAGALRVKLGGGDTYHGQWKVRPDLGLGADPVLADLPRVRRLIDKTLLSWMLFASALLVAASLRGGAGL